MSLLAPGLSARIKGFPNRKPPALLPFYSSLVAPEWRWFHDDLLGGIIAWEGNGKPFIFGGNTLAGDFGANAGWANSLFGPVLEFLGTTGSFLDLDNIKFQELSLPFSWFMLANISDTDDAASTMWQTQDWLDQGAVYSGVSLVTITSSTNNDFFLSLGDGTGGGPTDRRSLRWNGVIDFDKWVFYSGSFLTNITGTLYKDGILQSAPTTSGTGGSIATSSFNGRLGAEDLTATLWKGAVWGVINKEMRPSQHAQLAHDPFGPFRTRSLPLFLPSVADTFDTALLGSSSPRWDRRVRVY